MGIVVAVEEPVDERAKEKSDGGEDERVAEGAHGLGVEVEEVAEGERVIGGILFEESGEVGVGLGWVRVEDEEAADECGDGTEDEKDDRDALTGAGERVGDCEGFGFDDFVVEPGRDEKDQRRE